MGAITQHHVLHELDVQTRVLYEAVKMVSETFIMLLSPLVLNIHERIMGNIRRIILSVLLFTGIISGFHECIDQCVCYDNFIITCEGEDISNLYFTRFWREYTKKIYIENTRIFQWEFLSQFNNIEVISLQKNQYLQCSDIQVIPKWVALYTDVSCVKSSSDIPSDNSTRESTQSVTTFYSSLFNSNHTTNENGISEETNVRFSTRFLDTVIPSTNSHTTHTDISSTNSHTDIPHTESHNSHMDTQSNMLFTQTQDTGTIIQNEVFVYHAQESTKYHTDETTQSTNEYTPVTANSKTKVFTISNEHTHTTTIHNTFTTFALEGINIPSVVSLSMKEMEILTLSMILVVTTVIVLCICICIKKVVRKTPNPRINVGKFFLFYINFHTTQQNHSYFEVRFTYYSIHTR